MKLAACFLLPGVLVGSLFNYEEGDKMFLRNIRRFPAEYSEDKALHNHRFENLSSYIIGQHAQLLGLKAYVRPTTAVKMTQSFCTIPQNYITHN
jgi:hypothetical protein